MQKACEHKKDVTTENEVLGTGEFHRFINWLLVEAQNLKSKL